MAFTSILFLFCFLPPVIAVFYLLPAKVREVWLLLASFFFYAYSGPDSLPVLLAEALCSWAFGLIIGRSGSLGVKKTALTVFVAVELAVLCVYKYREFISPLLNTVFGNEMPAVLSVMPVGISFFTFQSLSYVIDVYRDGRYEKDPLKAALYLSFFPQLSAGPIVRYGEMAPQFGKGRVQFSGISDGMHRFCAGLCKKVLLADQIGAVTSLVFDHYRRSELAAPVLWVGAAAYTLQIYLDFSSYSDMAIGLGRMFGFSLPENFDLPYLADTASGFWRKWHMTLSSWFRDYIYIPLGGSRKGDTATFRNLLAVWLVTGIWHGAGWTFIVWGLMWFAAIAFERFVLRPAGFPAGNVILRRTVLFIFVILSWTVFRSADIASAFQMIIHMFSPSFWISADRWSGMMGLILSNYWLPLLAGTAVSFGVPEHIKKRLEGKSPIITAAEETGLLMLTVLAVSFIINQSYNPFLYLQF